jgi:NitT/TauT family transport system permease protein
MATATVSTATLDAQIVSPATFSTPAKHRTRWLTVWPLRILVLVAAAGFWQFLTTADVVLWARFDTVPSVTDIARAFWTSLGTDEYYLDLGQSLIRIGAGFALAVGVGVPVGIMLGRSRIATNTVGTLTEVLRPIPAIALVPVAILVLPTDEAGMVFITFVAAFFPISVATRHAVRALPTIWEDSVLTMGGRKRDVIVRVVLPGIAPGVFSGLSVGIGVAWICLISAEMISGRLGVGYRTWQAYTVVDYPQVFVGMLTIGILGALTSGGIELVGRRLTHWLPRAQENR